MNFPVYDISGYGWSRYKVKEHNVLYENPYTAIIPCNRKKFEERIKKFKFVGPDWIIYNVTGFKLKPKKGLAKLFFLTKKVELVFVKTDEQYTIEQFKELLTKRAKETQNKKLEDVVMNAYTIKDILYQF